MLPNVENCFICLSKENSHLGGKFQDLFGIDSDNISYLEKLKYVLHDTLLQQNSMLICLACLGKLKVSYSFIKVAKETQENLKNTLANPLVTDSKLEQKNVSLSRKGINIENSENINNSNNEEDTCEENFSDNDYEDHNRASSSDDDFVLCNNKRRPKKRTCRKCKKKFTTLKELRAHSCKKVLKGDQNDENVDMKWENNDAQYMSSCGEVAEGEGTEEQDNQNRSELSYLIKDDFYECTFCKQCFDTLDEVRFHNCYAQENFIVKGACNTEQNKSEEKSREEELSCQICGMNFKKHWMLRKHISRIHSEEKKYVCTYCNKRFKQSYHLREHITIHTGEKKYSCELCGKAFQRISSQKRHMRSHDAVPGQKTKRTPFLCTICGKSFPFSNGIQRHLRTHFGIKLHECNVCGRKFMQSTHLHVHMRTHTGERPYICDVCGTSFALNASLQRHKQSHCSKVTEIVQEEGC